MRFTKDIIKLSYQVPVKSFLLLVMVVSLVGVIGTKPSIAQPITAELAPSGTGTTVTPLNNRFDIEGGQLSGDGKNLFHSFTNFGLQQNQIANFLSQPTIQNILSRITSGNASVINGIIQVSGGNSNLFLINPAGIVFGQNASLNVPASFTATTANGVGFGSNGWFSASGPNNYASLVGTPSSLAFTTGQPGAIVNAANLAMQRGQNLTLVGGIVASTGELSASGGNIIVAAVPGTSLVRLSQPGSPLSLEIQPITPGSSQPTAWTLPVLSLAQSVTGGGGSNATGLTVNPDGTVQLTGSGIRIEDGDVVTQNINTSSTVGSVNGGSIMVSAPGDINTTGGTLNSSFSSTDSFASGNGGAITLTTSNGNITTADLDSYASASSVQYSGSGGAIALTTQNGNITTGQLNSYSAVGGRGNGGAIALTTQNGNITTDKLNSYSSNAASGGNGGAIALAAQNGNIATGDLDSHASTGGGIGNGGAISFAIQNGSIATGDLKSFSTGQFGGNGGAITLAIQNGNIATGRLSSYVIGGVNGGTIALTTQNGNITTGDLDSHASGTRFGTGNGGTISFTIQNGSIATGNLNSRGTGGAYGRGNGGAITFTIQSGNITTGNLNSQASGFYSGSGGAITFTIHNGNIITGDLDSQGFGLVGNGGAITFTIHNGNIATSKLSSYAIGAYDLGVSGGEANGGAITFTIQNGNITTGDLDSHALSFTGFGNGGAITFTIHNGNIATGQLSSYASARSGNGGEIALTTFNGNIATSDLNSAGLAGGNGGVVSVSASNSLTSGKINSSSVSGNGGSVTLNADKDIAVSSINAQGGEPDGSSGGNGGIGGSVNLATDGLIRISDFFTALDGVTTASISTQGGTGGGQIRIVTGGRLDNPFEVGDASRNGTAKDITSGNFRISSTPVFTVPSPIYTQGNIEIITLP